ncbi:MAG TPA: hypothetical protein VFV75_10370 [Candidatus Polarisedimenticolaceae bacterium]|nr:hypothetical protein [Candidatus Polarisedimenticolaceae bacterium]
MADTRGKTPAGAGPLDAARGRGDARPELLLRLATAPAAYLEGALGNPALDEEAVALLVRNPHATQTLLLRIGRSVRWARVYEVKRGLVRHPRVPVPLSRRLLPHLLWADLAEAAADTRLSPAVRRHAEETLKTRLLEMAEGEVVSLARRASAGLVDALARSRSPRVLAALLGNPRLRERDVVRIAAGEEAPAETLRRVARHPAWGERRAVRVALLRNPRTPVPEALHLVAGLAGSDLEDVVRDQAVPRIVQIGAGRRLAAERP